jgi:DNA mismatch repair protein MutS
LGYNHFYAETNVKDAYDATLAITDPFSENRNCFIVISTHMMELVEILRIMCGNFRYTYLPTVMEGLKPPYTYQLIAGITVDRLSMIIIENEDILDIIKNDSDKSDD